MVPFEVGAGRWAYDVYDTATQAMTSNDVEIVEGRAGSPRSVPLRVAGGAGPDGGTGRYRPVDRWEDWSRTPFTADSRGHVSVSGTSRVLTPPGADGPAGRRHPTAQQPNTDQAVTPTTTVGSWRTGKFTEFAMKQARWASACSASARSTIPGVVTVTSWPQHRLGEPAGLPGVEHRAPRTVHVAGDDDPGDRTQVQVPQEVALGQRRRPAIVRGSERDGPPERRVGAALERGGPSAVTTAPGRRPRYPLVPGPRLPVQVTTAA